MTTETRLPKLTGADIELGNFVTGAVGYFDSVSEASRILLAGMRDCAGRPFVTRAGPPDDPQDHGRTFLATNGGCAYIDLDHLELALPETLSAFEHVAHWHAMLSMVTDVQASINAQRLPGRRLTVLANNSDGHVSYGGHLNVLVTREAWENIVHRRPHYLAWLSALQASSLPITGQGK